MLVISHRGDHHAAIENTMEAFYKAISYDVDRIELDLQLSKDQQVFVMHDDHLLKITGKDAYISELTSEEIASMILPNGEKIPTLTDLIEKILPYVELNLEIKGSNIPLAAICAAALKNHPLAGKIIFSCFFPEPLIYLATYHPEFKTAALWGEDTKDIKELWFTHPEDFMNYCRTKIFHPQIDFVDESLMKTAKKYGWVVYPWASMKSIEDTHRFQVWKKLKDLGVHGLCTNYPKEMKAFDSV